MRKIKVLVTGATGFVGKNLCRELMASGNYYVIGLSRNQRILKVEDCVHEWRKGDLFSLRDCEQVLADVDVAFYLVHSMMPATRLIQGSFDDFDLALADNFARGARYAKLSRIIYLGGLVDRSKKPSQLSRHLRSRLEVEDALSFSKAKLHCLRAGLVVGFGGSSFEMMRKLVQNLYFIVCPPWTLTKSQSIAVEDLISLLLGVLKDESLPPGIYDIGGREVLSYREMLEKTATVLGVQRVFTSFPYVPPEFSRMWVSFFTNSPKELVAPLIASLKTTMVAKDSFLMDRYKIEGVGFEDAIQTAIEHEKQIQSRSVVNKPKSLSWRVTRDKNFDRSSVTSVQRLTLPKNWSIEQIAKEYGRWLNLMMWPFLHVVTDSQRSIRFFLYNPIKPILLLHLQHIPERSSKTREFYYITEGLMLRKNANARGRFEFRKIEKKQEVLVAIFDYEPSLPWFIYRFTQAIVHLLVMQGFARHLRAMDF